MNRIITIHVINILKRCILALIIGLLVFSCGSLELNDSSNSFIDKTEVLTTRLELNNDNSFTYRNYGHMTNQLSAGRWRRSGNDIILKSREEFKVGIKHVSETNIEIDSTKIQLFEDAESPVLGATIVIDDNYDQSLVTDRSGTVILHENNLRKIQISFLHHTFSYNVKHSTSNSFQFQLDFDTLGKKYFDNEVWKLRGKTIIGPDKQKLSLKR